MSEEPWIQENNGLWDIVIPEGGIHWKTVGTYRTKDGADKALIALIHVKAGRSPYAKEASLMATDETYQGWTNFETWGVALILDNDQTLYHEAGLRAVLEPLHAAVDSIKEMVETLVEVDALTTPKQLMTSQLLQAAMDRVDWRAIVEHYRET